MQVREIMTENPACCTPDTKLTEVARMMMEHDCGAIPVIEKGTSRKLVGIVTDRDIVCRTLAENKNPTKMTAEDCMTDSVITVTPDSSLEDCCERMEESQVRRVPVVDRDGSCCGMVAQADVAMNAPETETGEVV